MPPEFRIHLREAIDQLGYFKSSAIEDLLSLCRERWPNGISSTMFRREQIHELLSEKGMADWYHAQRATLTRAYCNLRRSEFDAAEANWSQFASHVRFSAPVPAACATARELHGSSTGRQDRWMLPMATCSSEWCPCRWDPIPQLD